jgi:putative transport protein
MSRSKPGLASAWRKFELRAYRLDADSPLIGSTVAAAEARLPEHRLFIHRVRHGERVLQAEPGTILAPGDVVTISAPRQIIVELIGSRAEEVEDRDLLDIPLISADVFLISAKLAGINLLEASQQDWTRGLYLRSLRRAARSFRSHPASSSSAAICCASSAPNRWLRTRRRISVSSSSPAPASTSWCWGSRSSSAE